MSDKSTTVDYPPLAGNEIKWQEFDRSLYHTPNHIEPRYFKPTVLDWILGNGTTSHLNTGKPVTDPSQSSTFWVDDDHHLHSTRVEPRRPFPAWAWLAVGGALLLAAAWWWKATR